MSLNQTKLRTFAASTSVLPSVRLALPAPYNFGCSVDCANCELPKIVARQRTVSLHLPGTDSGTDSLLDGAYSGLDVASNLRCKQSLTASRSCSLASKPQRSQLYLAWLS